MRFGRIFWEPSAFALLVGTSALLGGAANAQTAEPADRPAAVDATAGPVANAPQDTHDAQDTQSAAADGDIIVTGTRRAARVQDVPVSIAVVSADAIADSGFTAPSDIQYLAPGVSFNPSVGAGFLIRGLGSQGFDFNLEKAVAVVVDDVVQGLPRSIGFNTLADVERIEVLKGPQGTLFGKNATAGVIFVVTRRPELGKFSAEGSARYGTDQEIQIENTVNLPISSNLAARLSGVFQQRDGYLNNRFNGFKGGGYRDYSLRAKLLWEATPDLDVYLLAELQDHRDDGTGALDTIRVFPNPPTPISPTSQTALDFNRLLLPYGIVFGPENIDYVNNDPNQAFVRQKSAQGIVTYKMGEYTLTSITAYKTQRSGNQTDGDNSATDFNKYNVGRLSAHQFSQEVRLNSPVGGFIDYVIGGYFFDQNVEAQDNQGGTRNRTDLPPNTYVGTVGQSSNYTAQSNSLAAFGQANLHVTDQFTAIVGARYTHDKVAASYFGRPNPLFNFIGVSPPDGEDSAKADDLSFKGTLQYDVTPDLMFFGSYAQGYKAPAIGTSRGVVRRVLPETIDSYEIGMKSQWFNRALTFNVSLFTQDFKNLQTTAVSFRPDGTYSVELSNAEGVRARGVELEAAVRAGPDLTFTGSFAYVDTKFLTYLTSCYRGQPIRSTPGPGCYAQGASTIFDATGLPSINSPKTTYNIGFNYNPPISDKVSFYTSAVYSYRSSAYTTAGDPNTILPGYGLLNANIGIGNPDGSLRLTLYARNLLDKFFLTRIRALQFGTVGSYSNTVPIEAKRTIGIKLDYSF